MTKSAKIKKIKGYGATFCELQVRADRCKEGEWCGWRVNIEDMLY